MNNFLQLGFLPRSYDAGLLILRLCFGLLLFFNHGLSKLTHYSQMSTHMPDPLHVGTQLSLILTLISEVLCALLVVIGLATRLAALYIVIELAIAFTLVHHMKLSGPGSGELALVYLVPFFVLVLAGAGRYSVDRNV
ncbi:MAG: DoxX family protein [Acidobacteriaceae bacterium]|nr:DoxX family protein [Acidobacteriaceae bacterium]